jgi:GH15 family glucan-1,4-alpha-glucosidase
MLLYRHQPTGLPLESYDLWEEAAAVCAALDACANFAELFADKDLQQQCQAAHQRMKGALLLHLYRPDLGRFAHMLTLRVNDDGYDVDTTIDSSFSPCLRSVWFLPIRLRSKRFAPRARFWSELLRMPFLAASLPSSSIRTPARLAWSLH